VLFTDNASEFVIVKPVVDVNGRSLIRIYVCMYISMYVCTYLCMYVHIYVCMYVHIYVCMYISMYVCMYISMYVCTYLCMYISMYVCTYLCMYVHIYVCLFVARRKDTKFNSLATLVLYRGRTFFISLDHGCQMVNFIPKIPILVYFGWPWNRKFWYIL
jgi:hypothetical protein